MGRSAAHHLANSPDSDTASTWQRGHTLIFLAEYYLITNDAVVLPAIEAYTVNIAKNQSLFGTVGHIYAEKNLLGNNAEGIGVTHSGALVQGVYWKDLGDTDGVAERAEGHSSLWCFTGPGQ